MGSKQDLRIKPVCSENRDEVLQLRVKKGQENTIETVEECLLEAEEAACWRPVALYDGEMLVGFAMYCFWQEEVGPQRVWLDRFLIDGRFQGKGYGRAFLEQLIERLYGEYGRQALYLSVFPGNVPAETLYTSVGFSFNGELDLKKERVMVLLPKEPGKS